MTFNASRYVRFTASGRQIGWLAPKLAARLAAWPEVFSCSSKEIHLLNPDSLAAIVVRLVAEIYAVIVRHNLVYAIERLDQETDEAIPGTPLDVSTQLARNDRRCWWGMRSLGSSARRPIMSKPPST